MAKGIEREQERGNSNVTVIRRAEFPPDQAAKISILKPEYTIHRTDGLSSGPVFFNVGDIFYRTQRAKDALHVSVTHPLFTNPRKSGDRLSVIDEIEQFAQAGESEITLSRDFPLNTEAADYLSREKIVERLRRSTFLPKIPEGKSSRSVAAQFIRAVLEHDKHDSFWEEEGQILTSKFNKAAYQRIRNEYGNREPEDFFENNVGDASRIIVDIVTSKLHSQRRTVGLLNETALISTPAELVKFALASDSEPRLKYEVLRTLNVAELLAKNERYTKGLKPLISEFQRAINNEIFDHGHRTGETRPETLYAIFDKATGDPLWDSLTDSKLTQDELERYQEIGILKELGWNVRHAIGIGKVFTNPRLKGRGSTVEKMIRDAEHRARLVGDEYVEPAGVTDLGGIMHVLMDETTIDGPKINTFIEMHKELARRKFGAGVKIEVKDAKNGSVGQSDNHKFRRIDIFVPKNPGSNEYYKIEMIFMPLREYLRNEYRVGEIDQKTGIRTGQAHVVYEDKRSTEAAVRMVPSDLLGDVDWNDVTRQEVEKDVAELQREDQIPFDELPIDFRPNPSKHVWTVTLDQK